MRECGCVSVVGRYLADARGGQSASQPASFGGRTRDRENARRGEARRGGISDDVTCYVRQWGGGRTDVTIEQVGQVGPVRGKQSNGSHSSATAGAREGRGREGRGREGGGREGTGGGRG